MYDCGSRAPHENGMEMILSRYEERYKTFLLKEMFVGSPVSLESFKLTSM